MADGTAAKLELDDIQSGVLRPRPAPYAASLHIAPHRRPRRRARIDAAGEHGGGLGGASDKPCGRSLVKRGANVSGTQGTRGAAKILSRASCRSSNREWPRGQEVSENRREQPRKLGKTPWDTGCPCRSNRSRTGRSGLSGYSSGAGVLTQQLPGIKAIWRQDCHALATEKEPFGFRDGISHPAVEGSGIPGSNPGEPPFKAGEFVLGYRDETGGFPPMPQPEVLGRNGSYAVFRKLHQRVAAFRQYLRANSSTPQEEELLAAKMMGRWRSGAPLALSPERDDPVLGADATRRNNSLTDDPLGLKTPAGSHIRRANPRDASVAGAVRLHRMIRRGTAYGPPLPEGILEDDGADRGIMFVFIGSHLKRQFEFVQSEWMNDGVFIGAPAERDPVSGANDGTGIFTVPRRPVRRRLQGLPRFVLTRGGEYCFIPGLRALRWLANQGT